MTLSFLLVLLSSISCCCFGLFLLYKTISIKLEKNLSQQISSFIIDGIKIYAFRAFSAIFQLLFYTSLALFILSKVLHKQFLWEQIGAFFLGGISMSICLFLLTGIIPKLIPKTIEKSKIYLANCMIIQFDCVSIIGLISTSLLLTNGLLLMHFTSYKLLIGYSLGIIFASFFTRIAGSLFKASSSIGNGISKLRHPQLPQQDARNPGHIIAISAHYIHKICGFCSDILGSYIISFLSMIIFAHAFNNNHDISDTTFNNLISLPFYIIFISLIASIIGYVVAHYRIKNHALQNPLLESLYVALFICTTATFFIMQVLPFDIPNSIWIGNTLFNPYIPYITGLLGGVIICYTAEILTTHNYNYAKKCAQQTEYGPTLVQAFGMEIGLKSNFIYLIYISIISIIAYKTAGLFGICIANIAMLSLSTTIIAINSFAPLAQSTHQIANLSTTSKTILNHTKKMQLLGQSTVAIGNVFSSVAAIFSSVSLGCCFIFLQNFSLTTLFSVDLVWLIGIIAGAIIPLSSTGFLIEAVRKIAKYVAHEIKRQFDQIPFLAQGKANPDIISFSDKIVRQCMDSLIIVGILIALIPILIGYLINMSTLLAFTIGTLLSTSTVTFYWAITGDLMNNSKHYLEQGKLGGTKSPYFTFSENSSYLASIFKDVLNPSLSIIIKSVMILTIIMMIFLN